MKSQTAPAIELERAKTICLANAGEKVPAISVKQERSQPHFILTELGVEYHLRDN